MDEVHYAHREGGGILSAWSNVFKTRLPKEEENGQTLDGCTFSRAKDDVIIDVKGQIDLFSSPKLRSAILAALNTKQVNAGCHQHERGELHGQLRGRVAGRRTATARGKNSFLCSSACNRGRKRSSNWRAWTRYSPSGPPKWRRLADHSQPHRTKRHEFPIRTHRKAVHPCGRNGRRNLQPVLFVRLLGIRRSFPWQGVRGRATLRQMVVVGVDAIPIVAVISFFIGLIIALQGAYSLRKFGALNFVVDMVAITITRELGPLMTAILVIGRSGSAFAAEIGTMKVGEEVDALETMGLNPIKFLVVPSISPCW